MTKKELQTAKNSAKATIADLKKKINDLLKAYKPLLDALTPAVKAYTAAKKAYDKKVNPKTEAKYTKAKVALTEAYRRAGSVKTAINNGLEALNAKAAELAALLGDGSKEAKKELSAALGFTATTEKSVKKLEGKTLSSLPAELTAVPEATVAPETDAETATEPETAPTETETVADEAPVEEAAVTEPELTTEDRRTVSSVARVSSVNIAPVTIDVTPFVERAIAATMEKLSLSMDRRIREYVDTIALPAVAAPTAAPTTSDGASAAASVIWQPSLP